MVSELPKTLVHELESVRERHFKLEQQLGMPGGNFGAQLAELTYYAETWRTKVNVGLMVRLFFNEFMYCISILLTCNL